MTETTNPNPKRDMTAADEFTLETINTGPKLYKGNVATVAALAEDFPAALPVQPLDTEVKTKYGYVQKLPPSFVVTRFQATGYGTYYMHYYQPKTGERSYRDVLPDLKLNVLTGTHGAELSKGWAEARIQKLGEMGRRLSCTLGTDPEVFAVDDEGKVVPAWNYLPGKDKPHKYAFHSRNGLAYWDGFQAEFTTTGADTCLLWVSDNIQGGLKSIHQAARKVGAKLSIDTVLPVDPDLLQRAEPQYVQFGCMPSYNAYGLVGNIQEGRDVPFRFAGGHLHFGVSQLALLPAESRQKTIEKYVKSLDMVLGVATVSLLGELDNPIRRQFYGQPGEYRMPKHGFEYRTLSNAWLCHPLAMNMVFDLARSVCGLGEEGFLEGWQSNEEEMIEIIMSNDITKAREVLERNKSMFRQICKVITGPYYMTDEHLDFAYKVWSSGIGSVVENPKDIVGNWDLEGTWITHGDGKGKNWQKAYPHLITGWKA